MIDKQFFSTKASVPEKQDFGSLQKEFDFQISFQLKGLKSCLQTYGVGRVLVLLLKKVPLGVRQK